jgi:hypothetical protein
VVLFGFADSFLCGFARFAMFRALHRTSALSIELSFAVAGFDFFGK